MSRLLCNKSIGTIFEKADKTGLFYNKLQGSDAYKSYVNTQAQKLIKNCKTKPEQLVKISGCVIGVAYDKYDGNEDVLNFACDLVSAMSDNL